MKKIKIWSEIPELKNTEFLVINVTHRDKKTGSFSEDLYQMNIDFRKKAQSGHWTLGKNRRFEYAVLFFHEPGQETSIFLGRKQGEPSKQGNRFIVHVDRWRKLGTSDGSIATFCDGLPVSAHPVVTWRRILGKSMRICWNSFGWQRPTGEAAKMETTSYVEVQGFGHEEWLFDWSKLLRPKGATEFFKYGFLQPISKYRERYIGSTMDVLLYTFDANGERVIVARIKNLYVPSDAEIAEVSVQYKAKNWLREMEEQLVDIGLKAANQRWFQLPSSIVNVRFLQEDVEFYDPRILVPTDHPIARSNRYHPLDWDGIVPISRRLPSKKEDGDGDPTRSEARRKRAAVEGTVIDPRHVKIQNAVYKFLKKKYRASAVKYEMDFIDLALDLEEETIFFEIKTASTVKKCIREALGQLLEYGHYANKNRAQKLIVVSDVVPVDDDRLYLESLRKRYGMPIHFSQWRWDGLKLADPI
jgi:hypothetical protein